MFATTPLHSRIRLTGGNGAMDDGGTFQQWGPAWWSVIIGAIIGVVTVFRAGWDTLMNMMGFRNKHHELFKIEVVNLKQEYIDELGRLREYIATSHVTLDKRINALEMHTDNHNKEVTNLRIMVAEKMVSRDEMREVERRLIDNLNSKFELLMAKVGERS